ncbi:hypothetical protein M378DRAFT_169576 [Amanita muscaria Koide BX008]|uniref:Uncharacterized protein n=1 Tax=Amanita muscaria (strain Koide BX008) TaxID=946122 RepID=A0A0C2WCY9_AMAMK|nr:hypothetical protein M378DRAFT_169576 [Amanita muscaria Koide BX008]
MLGRKQKSQQHAATAFKPTSRNGARMRTTSLERWTLRLATKSLRLPNSPMLQSSHLKITLVRVVRSPYSTCNNRCHHWSTVDQVIDGQPHEVRVCS